MFRTRFRRSDDRGVAMITTIMIGAVAAAMSMVVVDVTVSNLKNSNRDRAGGGALATAEAGISQAIAHIRGAGVGNLVAGATWGDAANAVDFNFGADRDASVWIEVQQAFNPPSVPVGTYVIHARGTVGSSSQPGVRVLEQTVFVKPFQFPMGVYAETITNNGTPDTFQQSVFAKNCIGGRRFMRFDGTDPYYGRPAAAHSAKYIALQHNGPCDASNIGNIHTPASPCNTTTIAGEMEYRYDADLAGGPLTSAAHPACWRSDFTTSKFTQTDLDDTYGTGITEAQLKLLAAKAREQGYYYTSRNGWAAPDVTRHPHAVLYFKLPATGPDATVTFQSEFDDYEYDKTLDCATNPPKTLVIVVDNGSVGSGGATLSSSTDLMGAMIVPKGNFKFTGGAEWTGPIIANTIDQWTGTSESRLDECFLDNLPGSILEVEMGRFREVDR